MKRLVALVLCLTMCLSLSPAAFAQEFEGLRSAEELPPAQSTAAETPSTEPLRVIEVIFTCSPEALTLTVFDSSGEELHAVEPEEEEERPASVEPLEEEDRRPRYLLTPGEYRCSAACEGYASRPDIPFTIEEDSEAVVELEIELQPVEAAVTPEPSAAPEAIAESESSASPAPAAEPRPSSEPVSSDGTESASEIPDAPPMPASAEPVAVSAVSIREGANDVSGRTLTIDLNRTPELSFSAVTEPAGSAGEIVWTWSETKGSCGSCTDHGDGTVSVSLAPAAKLATLTLTATDSISGKKSTVKLTTTRISTDIVLTDPAPGESLESGSSRAFGAAIEGNPKDKGILWSIPEEYAAFAKVSGGTVTALDVTEPQEITLLASARDGGCVRQLPLTIVPRSTAVQLLINGTPVSGTYHVYLNDPQPLTIEARVLPAGAKQTVRWSTGGTGGLCVIPVERQVNGSTLTVTAGSTDKGAKKASVRLSFLRHADSITILSSKGGALPAELTLKGKTSYTFKDSVSSSKDKTLTDKNVVWSVDDTDIASISKGKLTVKSFAGEEKTLLVTAAASAEGSICDTCAVTLIPDLSAQINLRMGGKTVNGTTQTVAYHQGEQYSFPVEAEAVGIVSDLIWSPVSTAGTAYYKDGQVIFNRAGSVTVSVSGKNASGKTVKASFKLNATIQTESLSISGADSVIAGKSLRLTAVTTPARPTNSKVSWSLDEGDALYASISSSGELKAAGVSTRRVVTVHCVSQDRGASASAQFTIYPAATSVRIDPGPSSTVDLRTVSMLKLSASVFPLAARQDVTWTSSNSLFPIDRNDGTIRIPVNASGATATYTATSADGKKSSVRLSFVRFTESVEITSKTGADFVLCGKSLALSAVLNAGLSKPTNSKVSWSLSPEDGAFASISTTGSLSAKKNAGCRVVTVHCVSQDNGTEALRQITIYPAVTAVGICDLAGNSLVKKTVDFSEGMQWRLSDTPEQAMQKWSVKCSDSAITAGVDPATQLLTLSLAPGAAPRIGSRPVITVTAADGSGKSAKVTLRIRKLEIVSHPEAVSVSAGELCSFSVSAVGLVMACQWESSRDAGLTWTDCTCESADTSCCSFTASSEDNGLLFRCRVSDAGGGVVYSDAAALTVIFTRFTENGLRYETLSDGAVKVVGCDSDSERIVVPELVRGLLVTEIGASAFENCLALEDVDLPDSVTVIGVRAFAGCPRLGSID